MRPGKRMRVRFWLGVSQIFFGTSALLLLVRDGLTPGTLGATVITCLLTTASVLLFGRRGPLDF